MFECGVTCYGGKKIYIPVRLSELSAEHEQTSMSFVWLSLPLIGAKVKMDEARMPVLKVNQRGQRVESDHVQGAQDVKHVKFC